jgi:hypothetical protein
MRGTKKWSIQEVWNSGFEAEDNTKVRNYLSASDIFASDYDVWLKCKGTPETNKPPKRVRRIFDAGNFFEELVCSVFDVIGILKDRQIEVEIPATDKTLKVIGKADCLVGGYPEGGWEGALERVENDKGMPEFMKKKARAMVKFLRENYPNGLEEILCEIKSVNSNAFWSHNNMDENGYFKGYQHHKGQLATYVFGKEMNFGRLFYISRDDFCLMETDVYKNEEFEKLWWEDVERKSNFIINDIEPPKPQEILWNENEKSPLYPNGKWCVNWQLQRSRFLTHITGIEGDKWEDDVKARVKELNEAIKKQTRADNKAAKEAEKEAAKNLKKGGE